MYMTILASLVST
uniref:Uncharacterized protein n=1 Tax=Arundo donax TaxID=35708 RepID=A0A0A9HMJ3_ARUDO